MKNVHVKTWEDWETLCEYWMQAIALHGFGINTRYKTYGRKGQKQHGVDIIPVLPGCDVVGQSKFVQQFDLDDLKAELAKTDTYPGPISNYYLLTTAGHCTSVDNAQAHEAIKHTRPDGTTFTVRIFYWSNVQNIDFLPEDVKHTLFPEVKRLYKSDEQKSPIVPPLKPEEIRDKLLKLKTLLQKTFTEANIEWLETWNFRNYSIYCADYDAFHQPYLEWTMVECALRQNNQKMLEIYLDTESRIAFYETWPVSKAFFFALEEFHKAGQQYIGGDYRAQIPYLTVSDLPNRNSAAHQMESAAHYIAEKYRDIVQ